jgi:hypothetical protein
MTILLATDGSPCGEAAVNEVADRPWPEIVQTALETDKRRKRNC